MRNQWSAAVPSLNTYLLPPQFEAGKGPKQQRCSSSRRKRVECNKPVLVRPIESSPPFCMRLSSNGDKAFEAATAAAWRAPLLLLLLLLLHCCLCVQLKLEGRVCASSVQ